MGFVVTGCNREGHTSTSREGMDLTVAGLDYKVQLARILNRFDSEDRPYLGELPAPLKGVGYLGVFIRISNHGNRTQVPTNDFSVVDTQGVRYRPVRVDTVYAYRAEPIPPDEQWPPVDSTADVGPTAGAELLFKIQLASVSDDPLVLEIPDHGKNRGEIYLDI